MLNFPSHTNKYGALNYIYRSKTTTSVVNLLKLSQEGARKRDNEWQNTNLGNFGSVDWKSCQMVLEQF